MTEIRRNEFKDMLEMNEILFVEYKSFIKADIPKLGEVTYYPRANKLQICKSNKWEQDGFYYIKNHLKSIL